MVFSNSVSLCLKGINHQFDYSLYVVATATLILDEVKIIVDFYQFLCSQVQVLEYTWVHACHNTAQVLKWQASTQAEN